MSIEKFGPSEEIQKQFSLWAQDYYGDAAAGTLRLDPSRFFAVWSVNGGKDFRRAHHSLDLRVDSHETFAQNDVLDLTPEDLKDPRIGVGGEFGNFIAIKLYGRKFSIRTHAENSRKQLEVEYEKGEITDFSFIDFDDQLPWVKDKVRVKSLSETITSHEMQMGTRWIAKIENGNLFFEYQRGEITTDLIIVPKRVEPEGMFQQILDPRIISDPYGAAPVLDRTWRDPERIKLILGLEWTEPEAKVVALDQSF